MRAVILRERDGPLNVMEVPDPTRDADGVIVEVEVCGVCRSDWRSQTGHGERTGDTAPSGQIPDYEPASRVIETSDRVETIRKGGHAALPFNPACGSCGHCQTDHGSIRTSDHPYALDFKPAIRGAFAELVYLPPADYNTIQLPGDTLPADMATLGCRFITAYDVLNARAGLHTGRWAAVHGCGDIGLSATQVANVPSAHATTVDVCESTPGAVADLNTGAVVDGPTEGPVDVIRELTDDGAYVPLDASGVAKTCRNSVRSVRLRGSHARAELTTEAEEGSVSLLTDWMTRHKVSFLDARGIPPTNVDDLPSLLTPDAVDPESLVTKTVLFDEVPERLAAMTDYGIVGVEATIP